MKNLLTIMALALSAPLAAQTATPSAPAPAANSMSEDSYLLGPGDTIEVRVLGQNDFTTRARIREDGTIALPFVGDVKATGENSTAFARTVAARLDKGGFYAKPIVNVEIVSFASRYVTVLGAIAQSGLQPVDREYHLSEILARAGGLRADSNDEIVIRNDAGQEQRLAYSSVALGLPDSDPIVRPGDRIFAPVAENFYIYGQVNAPGAYPTKKDLSIRNALGRAGGLTPNGSQGKVKIFRKGQQMKLSLEDKVLPGDTIVVGERLF
ncbi:MAG TPA: polysaccharide biosynthesis/export family protein [Sphingomonas sp.]|nr:polysaccharide biosynthesis/export family protein [Sphingomonas sp.]